MSFLDEQTVTTDDEQKAADLAKQGVDVKLVDKVDEKKKDHDGDGDIDSDDYLIARDKAIKKAMGKKVEEGAASKFLGALGIAAALLAVGNQNKSDSVLKAIDAKIEQADNPAEKAALKKLASQRLIWLDTGKGPGGDIKASDVGAVLKELSEKSCGCGQTPCKTYGKVSEDMGDSALTALKGLDSFIDSSYKGDLSLTGIVKTLLNVGAENKIKDEKDLEFYKKVVGALNDKKNPKVIFKKDSDDEKRFFKILKDAGVDNKDIENIKELIKAIREKNSTNENMSEDKEKTIELPADTTFTLDLKHLMKKHMNEGKSKEDAIKFTKALMKKLHDKGEVTVDGTKIIFKEIKDIKNIKAIIQQAKVNRDKAIKGGNEGMADKIEGNLLKKLQDLNYDFKKDPDAMEVLGDFLDLDENDIPQDAPLALPEPEAPDYLGADGKDYEGGMAKSQMLKMKNYAKALCDMVDDETQLEAWVQAKITKASDYMSAVYHYLDYQKSKMNEAFELNGRKVVDLEADGGGSRDPFIGAAYYLDTGEALTDNEIEDVVDKYPADLEPGGMWWDQQR